MDAPLAIAVVLPHAWPPRDDVAHHAAREARALAGRGHRVTILAPGSGRERLAEGRRLIARARSGDAAALLAEPGEARVVAAGRALPPAAGRRLGAPFDLAAALHAALEGTPFDVVHVHEPLSPSPALAALRHAEGAAVATFHRPEPLAGAVFLAPLVDRALARLDLRVTTGEVARRALQEVLPGEYLLIPPGVDVPPAEVPAPEGPPGVVVFARGRDRAGVRFGVALLRALAPEEVGAATLVGPAEAPWRTRAAVPRALRPRVSVVADPGPEGRADLLARGPIAVLAAPGESEGPVLREAMAAGCAVVAARSAATDEVAERDSEALILPPFSRRAWADAVTGLAADPAARAEIGARARARAGARGWDAAARDLEGAYRRALDGRATVPGGVDRVLADLRVRGGPRLDGPAIVAAAVERGLGAVAVASPDGLGPALAAAAAAPDRVAVIVGQEVATREGVLVGLFLSRGVPHGLDAEEAARAIHAQGGVVVAPHPASLPCPPPEILRRLGGAVDCHELLAPGAAPWEEEAVAVARRVGVLGSAGSGAEAAGAVGSALTELRAFHGAADLLDALADARLSLAGAAAGRDPGAARRGARGR